MTSRAFDSIAAGLEDAIAFAEGKDRGSVVHIPEQVDLRSIRKALHMSQPEFAKSFGFSVGRIRDWEQGRTPIDASSRVLLTVIRNEPDAVRRALAAG